ncbi:MAG TPA: phosphate acyltransferase PlsX [Candidatus Kapabacteria bacterium]|nr:phosphate acyltransferase PlsX [Candidatus Kapabacteria bacterium]HPO62000.1 phosphate acyltransferase PlsX [Candidatus Kapabacteria bacterium]
MNTKPTYKIALDAMGGDFAPANEIKGALLASEILNQHHNIEIVFVGDESKIKDELSKQNNSAMNYSIHHTDEIVDMHDDPTQIVKTKKNSSLYKAMELHSERKVDAFVSAGNTGAVLSTGTILLGRIKGVSRPTIGSFFPTVTKRPVLILDVGANLEPKPKYLYEFAVMGSIFSKQMLNIERPKVGLLNVGEEKEKGTELLQETNILLSESNLNFIGNVEGRDLLQGNIDVVICDGFTGNVVLKFAEGVFSFLKGKIKAMAAKSIVNKGIILLISPFLKNLFKELDYQQYGGVPLLGVDGVVIIGHGKSSPLAIQNMIIRAVEYIDKNINEKIKFALNL